MLSRRMVLGSASLVTLPAAACASLPQPGASPFASAEIDPETLAINARVEAILAQSPPAYTLSPAQLRAGASPATQLYPPDPPSSRAISRDIQGAGGPINLRWIAPARPRALYMHLHGGGWVRGANQGHDAYLEHLADAHEFAAVSVNYRLAPERPYPAAPNDCEAAARWLLANGRDIFGAQDLIIGGESAGAHLAAVTALRLRDSGDGHALRALALAYGLYDLTLTPSVRNWGDRLLALNTAAVTWCRDQFVADPGLALTGDVSPLRARLAGLPPALFMVGTLDPLLDDTTFMHARYEAAGNVSRLELFPGGIHGFRSLGGPLGRRYTRMHDAFLRSMIART